MMKTELQLVALIGMGVLAVLTPVQSQEANNPPTFEESILTQTVAEDADNVPDLTVATDVFDVDGDELTVMLNPRSTPGDLFAFPPTLVNPTIVAGSAAASVVIAGGVLNANTDGEWTATVPVYS